MHRVGGLEKKDGTGNIDYTPENHEHMVHLRAGRDAAIAADIRPTEIDGDPDRRRARSSDGARPRRPGSRPVDPSAASPRRQKVASAHVVHLNPLPPDLGDILRRFERVIVPELNMGQLHQPDPRQYLVGARCLTKVQGIPLRSRPRSRPPHRRGARLDRQLDRQLERSNVMSTAQVGVSRPKKDWSATRRGPLVPRDRRLRHAPRRAQTLMPISASPREHTCLMLGPLSAAPAASPSFVNTYGMHSIPPAPPLATGVARRSHSPTSDVWVITGDGDGLWMAATRPPIPRTPPQREPRRAAVKTTGLRPAPRVRPYPRPRSARCPSGHPAMGAIDPPFNPLAVALDAGGELRGAYPRPRPPSHDRDVPAPPTLTTAPSFVEIYQNCNVFNDGQFDEVTKKRPATR